MSAIAEQMREQAKTSSLDLERFALHSAGADAMRRTGMDEASAASLMWQMIQDDEDLCVRLCRHYISTVIAPDMRGPSQESVRGGRISYASGQHAFAASHGPVEDGEGHRGIADQARPAVPSPSSPVETAVAVGAVPKDQEELAPAVSPLDASEARGQVPEGRLAFAFGASSHHDGSGHARITAHGHSPDARPVVNPPRGVDAIRSIQRPEDLNLFDRLTLFDIPVGDLTMTHGNRLARKGERESRIWRNIADAYRKTVTPNLPLRTFASTAVIQAAFDMEQPDAA